MRHLLLLSLLLAVPAMAVDLYVSPDGKDMNAGTKSAPFQTLGKARDTLRALKAQGPLPKGGATVWLWGGVYRADSTFELTKADSGTADAPIVYRAVKPGTVRLMGGATLPASAFTAVTDPQLLERLDPS
ncbi:MAG: hypothetical protein WCP21_12650, partial [Armatimonadota bacterium]